MKPSNHKPIILLVEDRPEVRYLWECALKRLDVEVWEAPTLAEAKILCLKIPPPDLIFLDLRLGDSEAIETIEGIEDFREGNPNVVVVIVSGYLDKKTITRAFEKHVQGVWDKNNVLYQKDLWNVIKHAINKAPEGAKERMNYLSMLIEKLEGVKTSRLAQ